MVSFNIRHLARSSQIGLGYSLQGKNSTEQHWLGSSQFPTIAQIRTAASTTLKDNIKKEKFTLRLTWDFCSNKVSILLKEDWVVNISLFNSTYIDFSYILHRVYHSKLAKS